MNRNATIWKGLSATILAVLFLVFSVSSAFAAKSSDHHTWTKPCFAKKSMPLITLAERTDNLSGFVKHVQHLVSILIPTAGDVSIKGGALTPDALTVNAHAQNAIYMLPSIHAP